MRAEDTFLIMETAYVQTSMTNNFYKNSFGSVFFGNWVSTVVVSQLFLIQLYSPTNFLPNIFWSCDYHIMILFDATISFCYASTATSFHTLAILTYPTFSICLAFASKPTTLYDKFASTASRSLTSIGIIPTKSQSDSSVKGTRSSVVKKTRLRFLNQSVPDIDNSIPPRKTIPSKSDVLRKSSCNGKAVQNKCLNVSSAISADGSVKKKQVTNKAAETESKVSAKDCLSHTKHTVKVQYAHHYDILFQILKYFLDINL